MMIVAPARFGVAVAYTKWRLKALSITNNGTIFILSEVQFRATAGGSAISGGTAVASSEFSGSFLAANAFDGTTSTEWATLNNQGVNGWIGKDWGVDTVVEEISFTVRSSDVVSQPLHFVVEKFNSITSTWETAWYDVLGTYTGTETVVSTRLTTKSAWRVRLTSSSSSFSTVGYAKVEFRATASGADQATGGRPLAHGFFGGSNLPAQAFDANAGTIWVDTNGVKVGGWVGYRWNGTNQDIQEVTLKARADLGADTAGTGFAFEKFDYSSGAWTSTWTATTPNTWSLGETRVFTKP